MYPATLKNTRPRDIIARKPRRNWDGVLTDGTNLERLKKENLGSPVISRLPRFLVLFPLVAGTCILNNFV
jgi:hypothetical protein